MKSATTLLLAIALCAPASARLLAQEQPSGAPREMSDYYFGFLFNGPNWSAEETEELAQRQEAHLAYLRSLFEAGNLVACGPTFSKEDFRGVVIFKTATLGEARALAASDPHIRAGYFRLELLPWRGTAGIGQNWAKWTVNPDELTSYQLVVLSRGANSPAGEPGRGAMTLDQYVVNLDSLFKTGKVAAGGSFIPSQPADKLGVLFFRVHSELEARALIELDPTMEKGNLTIEVFPWWTAPGVLP